MLRKIAIGLFATVAATGIAALAQTFAPDMPILGGPSYCASTVNNVCQSTIPAGPALTGNETVPADTNPAQAGGIQSGKIPVPLLYNKINGIVGGDFGQNLWQRGTSFASLSLNTAIYTADGWYVYGGTTAPLVTVSKQTGAASQPPGSLASMRIQRVANQTATGQYCVGQLLPDAESEPFINASTGTRTAIFSVELQQGANFSPLGVNLVIGYHTATDVTTGAANGQGTNTGIFASSLTGTQNITNYTEAVNTLTTASTSWARYSVAAQIPYYATGTTTQTLGVGVKICLTGVGTAGTNDYLEIGNAQLEYRGGTSTAPSPFVRRNLADDWNLQLARYWTIQENGSAGTPIYASAIVGATNQVNILYRFPQLMRITPITSPITIGGFKLLIAGTQTTPGTLVTTGVSNTPATGALSSQTTATAGQASEFVGSGAGTGVIGWSAEP